MLVDCTSISWSHNSSHTARTPCTSILPPWRTHDERNSIILFRLLIDAVTAGIADEVKWKLRDPLLQKVSALLEGASKGEQLV